MVFSLLGRYISSGLTSLIITPVNWVCILFKVIWFTWTCLFWIIFSAKSSVPIEEETIGIGTSSLEVVLSPDPAARTISEELSEVVTNFWRVKLWSLILSVKSIFSFKSLVPIEPGIIGT